MTAWHQGSSVPTQFTWMAAEPACWDTSRSLSLKGDTRCLVYLAHCSPTNAASWSERYTVHGLPAAALTQALSKLMHPRCFGFSFSPIKTALLTPFPAIKAEESKEQRVGFLTILPTENAGSCPFLGEGRLGQDLGATLTS